MSRKELPVRQEHSAPFDLETFVNEAAPLHQRTLEAFTLPCPKAPPRWLSHDPCKLRPIECTPEGAVEGGLRGLLGATIARRFTRALCAPDSSTEGGPCDDPASSFCLALASRVERSSHDASFCAALRQQEKGRRSRELAGRHTAIPGEDAPSHFRRRVDASAIEAALAVLVGLVRAFGLVTGERLATDGQLEPSFSRFKGWAYCWQDGQRLPRDEASRQERCRPLQAGAKRREIRCPFPEGVPKILHATRQKGKPREPTVALLEIESRPADSAPTAEHQQLADWLSRPPDQLPPLRLQWSHLSQGPQGELWGSGPQGPSALEARVGYQIDTKAPPKTERVFGYRQHTTTHLDIALGWEVPVGTATSPATVHAGRHFAEHRAKVAIPFQAQQIELADAGDAVLAHDQGTRGRGGSPSIAYHPRHEERSPEALLQRGDDRPGPPSAPCGRLCRSNGDTYQSASRQSVCGLPCPLQERERCPHGQQGRGYTPRLSFTAYPRLIGPCPRGRPAWRLRYAARTASERTNSSEQEVIDHGHPPRLRGLTAFRCSGVLRTRAHLLRRALNVVRDVTSTWGK